ncbi:MAG: ribosomal RNA small subunit methyltransferase A [Firmicutes bacterium]|nr:ribosomal RNA small subunit methyltransferase A [Bacillota bacterium]
MDQNLTGEIIAALNTLQLRPHNLRGQNFLVSREIIDKIIAASPPSADLPILEIGAGLASLSDALVPRAGEIDLLEIEPLFACRLQERFADNKQVTVHCVDALNFDYRGRYGDKPYLIYGNIPYNITTPLLKKLLLDGANWQMMILIVQKEAAERLCYCQKRNNGPLPLMLDYLTEQEIAFTVPRTAFYPQPAVESAILKIKKQENVQIDDAFLELIPFMEAAFGLRRKTLANSLAASAYGGGRDYWQTLIQSCGLAENIRAESLNLADMLRLYNQHISQ